MDEKYGEKQNNSVIPFNLPFIIGNELEYIKDAVESGKISGNGKYTRLCQEFLENYLTTSPVLLTTSCTDALEMAALLSGVGPEDEVILPSFTFVTTANAFALRNTHLVFVDIREDTLNIDESLIEERITDKTKVIVPVHYAGVACEMDIISDIARKHNLMIVEDAAQALGSRYKGRALGTIGDFGTLSFHETKNVICGEGGSLLVNNKRYAKQAYICWEKGTNRRDFSRGIVNKYEWIDYGSSYLPSDIIAAFLYAQLEHIEEITARRRLIFSRYEAALTPLQDSGLLRIPMVPETSSISYHMFYVILETAAVRERLLEYLNGLGITAVFHYLPLHSSPFGKRYGISSDALPVTTSISERLLRLPFYYQLSEADQNYIINSLYNFFGQSYF